MEGSECEELKSVKSGSPECLQVKRKRVDKKKKKHGASRLQIGTDADHHQVTVEEEESVSWVELEGGVDASQGSSEKSFKKKKKKKHASSRVKRGSPECLQVKRKRVDKKKKKKKKKKKHGASSSRVELEGGLDASQGSSEKSFKKKKKKKKHASSRLQRCTDASKEEIAGGSEHRQVKRKRVKHKRLNDRRLAEYRNQLAREHRLVEYRKQLDLKHAKMALEFYEKSQDDAEFEILEVLNRSNSRLQHPESVSGHLWSHISFIAKPRKADYNVSPKHFFGEFFRDDVSRKIHVTYCSTFQPSDDPGFNHGCIFCPPGQRFHPSDGYCVGRPPWHRRRAVFGHPSRLRKGTDVSQGDMAGGSDRHQVKRKRVDESSFSWLQRCTDASSTGEIAGGSEHRQVKRKRVKHKRLNDDDLSWLVEYRKQLALEHAKMALEFYEKSQDEFEILEVLNVSDSRLQHPESVSGHLWSHISFIAKPKKADCNVSPKHFFGEFFRDDDSGKIHVTYCSTYQPRDDDPGLNHGCMLCSRGQRFHPSNGYCVGRPPWH